jgi:hypothetical protein
MARTMEPCTLGEAHDVLRRVRPFHSASAHDWLAYHQRAAQLYQHISRIDPNHHHEALYFAATEREDAEMVSAEIQGQRSASTAEIEQPSGGGVG